MITLTLIFYEAPFVEYPLFRISLQLHLSGELNVGPGFLSKVFFNILKKVCKTERLGSKIKIYLSKA